MATFVTLAEEHTVISAGTGQKPLGRHERYSEQKKNYPGKKRISDISILQAYKGICLLCNIISKDSNSGQ